MHTSEHVDIPEYLYKREHKFTLDLHLYKNLIGELSRLISHGQSKTRKTSKEKSKGQNSNTEIFKPYLQIDFIIFARNSF